MANITIETMKAQGEDAFQNAFDFNLGGELLSLIPIFSELQNVGMRVQNVSIPGFTIQTYDVHYKSMKITRPSGKIEDPKEFSFQIRLDRQYLLYRGFRIWQKMIQDHTTGAVRSESVANPYRTTMTLTPTDPSLNVAGIQGAPSGMNFQMKGAFPLEVPAIDYDYTSGEPITLTINMGMLYLDDSGLLL